LGFEGNNSRTFPQRAARAHLLIWLDVPLWLRLTRVIKRSLIQRGKTRPDMADGCTEQLRTLPGFLWFVVSTARASHRKQSMFFQSTSLHKHRLTTARHVNTFVETLT
jgi:Adenylate kinase and related kinases